MPILRKSKFEYNEPAFKIDLKKQVLSVLSHVVSFSAYIYKQFVWTFISRSYPRESHEYSI